ncbi:hypothetical protein BDW02DRAFT_567987 [Decorospora gaudefroyi]|uniref:Large ribosomal subunit protein uL23m n=1 Tax=Decorospora gaudefroyi TaxID=184978 RepID=A0A6A5KI74_9PLEO|nr:hypothetical protein BDW02DRAFT_567987 [Decorospora gaudefroyi]
MDAIPITKKLIAFGSKKIYLPKFTITLVRSPASLPYHARFKVPLDFSKYDLRDYLYHAYNVRCFNIRSFVKQMPVRDTQKQARHWFRPESEKYMTVEMEQPFVWPEVPNLDPWSPEQRQREVDLASKNDDALDKEDARAAARSLQQHVKELLEPEPKEAQRVKPSSDTLKAGAENDQRHAIRKDMSRLALWERKRTGKVVEGDESDQYAIKV